MRYIEDSSGQSPRYTEARLTHGVSHKKIKRKVTQKSIFERHHATRSSQNAKKEIRNLNITVLAGGRSPERDISLSSGRNVAEALIRLSHKTALIDPAKETEPSRPYFHTDKNDLEKSVDIESSAPFSERETISEGALRVCEESDIVFLALHGGNGENGRLQALFDSLGVRYTGSGAHASSLAMDKAVAKRVYTAHGIPTPRYVLFNTDEKELPEHVGFPCVIKPANGGSSVGITFAENERELALDLEKRKTNAPQSAETLIIEQKITGREFTVGILCDAPLAVTEIIPKQGFYDYENKYIPGRTEEVTPADLSAEQTEKALRLAISAHKALGLKNFSRTDILLDSESEEFFVLETNTLPGMTKTSLLPLGAAACGIDFDTLCEKMLI